ncbi:MAG: hypothetical protein KBT21_07885 [Treponema sp.]|nr:hypothetical protein [Candidatus Treponema merdequi]
MLESQWKIFSAFKKELKEKCLEWNKFAEQLVPLQKKEALTDTPDYPFENAVVYNTALDELTPDSEIKLIVIGDNPGKSEQLNINQKYLVGQAGKLAEGFFRNNPDLKIDFRKNVIILNKTPVHSAKTKHLAKIEKALKQTNSPASDLIRDSQIWMAQKTSRLHIDLFNAAFATYTGQPDIPFLPELWLVGYSELKPRGLFIPYRDTLARIYTDQSKSDSATYAGQSKSTGFSTDPWSHVFVYQHFSMNCFTKDLSDFQNSNKDLSLKSSLEKLGTIHKDEIFTHLDF